ncbi:MULTISPECIES: ABC transporter permease [Glutamicibacter]|uniref:ABC transporter permease n=2 Tax=Glutamicibacter arilaitensis TaxID=256701 RepID=A0A2N7S5T3_9MICC|nr:MULTISPECIES: ABC transporter permease [Glutamicibacter]PMQ21501.1 ABC transporter permease [Glutamicibacter arilaitensis]HCH46469.1 ABC transporter permease [Glutamicibacter sp.]HCM95523.1 ABC transporter permease [Glutamicibacter sp.]
MNWIMENLGLIGSLSVEHLRQSAMAILIGFALSIPLGWVAWRYKLVRGPLVTLTGLLYTIPSLALLMILPVITGMSAISEANLVVALSIYAVAIMVRGVVDGLNSVDPATRSAATAMGYGPARRFFAVDLPLAGPVILAGLRVTAVSTISLATVGILVGVTNLGYLFTNGLQRRIIAEVFAGILAVALIALVIDLLLLLAGRWLMPWNSSGSKTKRSVQQASGEQVDA